MDDLQAEQEGKKKEGAVITHTVSKHMVEFLS